MYKPLFKANKSVIIQIEYAIPKPDFLNQYLKPNLKPVGYI